MIFAVNHDVPGNPINTEQVCITINGVNANTFKQIWVERIDDDHCNPYELWISMGSPEYPTRDQIRALKKTSELQAEKINYTFVAGGIQVQLTLPPQGVAAITIQF